MSPAAIALALGAAVLHAGWNAFLRTGGDRLRTITVMSLASTAVALPAVALLPLPAPAGWPWIFASALLQVVYSLVLVAAYRYGELGQVYPIVRGTVPILVTVGGAVVAGEAPSPGAMLGVALIGGGIASLAFGRGATRPLAVVLALATGAIIAAYGTTDSIGVRVAAAGPGYTAWVLLLYGAALPVAARILGGPIAIDVRSRDTWTALAGGLVAVLAYAAVVAAFALAPAGPVTALRETSVVFAALIGHAVLGERLTPRRLAASAVVVLGAVCIVA